MSCASPFAYMASGRVRRKKMDGRNVYELAADFDTDLQQRLREAERLLCRHGYDVKAPGAVEGGNEPANKCG